MLACPDVDEFSAHHLVTTVPASSSNGKFLFFLGNSEVVCREILWGLCISVVHLLSSHE